MKNIKNMNADICLKIPDICYISANPGKGFPFSFAFEVTYGNLPAKKYLPAFEEDTKAVKYPQLTVKGFEKLLSDPEEIDGFIKSLKLTGDQQWLIKKGSGTEIIIRYTGLELKPDFFFCGETDKFVSDCQENTTITLTVSVENFDETANYEYVISTKAVYAPWAKSLTAQNLQPALNSQIEIAYEYLGDNVDKKLYQNGQQVNSPSSPYLARIDKPALFNLVVFNNRGVSDSQTIQVDVLPPEIKEFKADREVCPQGMEVRLDWQLDSAANFSLDGIDKQKDKVYDNYALVYPQGNTAYTLRADGYVQGKPHSVTENLNIYGSRWQNAGPQQGFFAGSADNPFADLQYNSRIFLCDGEYYCYKHPCLYQSKDGLNFTAVQTNDAAGSAFQCIAAGYHDYMLYAMGATGGDRLYITTYNFQEQKWNYQTGGQKKGSDKGCFAFDGSQKAYAQIVDNGMVIVRQGPDGQWNRGGSSIKAPSGTKVRGGDFTFYKDCFYAVFLCDDNYFYVYKCSEAMQTWLFRQKTGSDDSFISFGPTDNNLYVLTASGITDCATAALADLFSPMEETRDKRMWLGCDTQGRLMGIYPDGNLWIFE